MLRSSKWSFIVIHQFFLLIIMAVWNIKLIIKKIIIFSPVNEWRAIAFTSPHKITNVGYRHFFGGFGRGDAWKWTRPNKGGGGGQNSGIFSEHTFWMTPWSNSSEQEGFEILRQHIGKLTYWKIYIFFCWHCKMLEICQNLKFLLCKTLDVPLLIPPEGHLKLSTFIQNTF